MDSIEIDLDNEELNFFANDVNTKKMDNDTTINEEDYKYLDMNIDFNVNSKYYSENNNNKLMSEDVDFPYQIVQCVPEYNRMIIIDPDRAPTNFCWRCKVCLILYTLFNTMYKKLYCSIYHDTVYPTN